MKIIQFQLEFLVRGMAHFAHNMFIRLKEKINNKNISDFTIINASDISNPYFKDFGMNSKTFVVFI